MYIEGFRVCAMNFEPGCSSRVCAGLWGSCLMGSSGLGFVDVAQGS